MLLQTLSRQSKLTESQLEHYAWTASMRYKVYEIDKRDGGKRTIEHPSRPLKAIQRWVNSNLLEKLPVHACATAYSKGVGIKFNAKLHSKTNYTLRLDFELFFPSFKSVHIRKFLELLPSREFSLSARDIAFLTRIFCRNGGLTVGAPSSPKLTNVMMYSFDHKVSEWCRKRNLVYSRYADDIFVSSQKKYELENVEAMVAECCKQFSFSKLRIKKSKTLQLSRKYHRSVTGLVITTERRVSLGRERKRMIRSLVFRHLKAGLSVEDFGKVLGLLSFAFDVERSFYDLLAQKFEVGDVLRAVRGVSPKNHEADEM